MDRGAPLGYHAKQPVQPARKRLSSAMTRQFTAIIEREDDVYVALCPELDIASQGAAVSEARANLREAIKLFLETASPEEVQRRLSDEVYVTQIEVAVG
jgi:predicted RNase H-like HicB family nuclease